MTIPKATPAPDLPEKAPESPQESTQQKQLATAEVTADLRRDIQWAYHWCDRKKHPRPPSPGAKMLLKLAREQPRWFAQTLLMKVLPKETETDREAKADIEDAKSQQNLVNRALKVISEAGQVYSG
jgi:hypothetical protein